MTNIYIFGILVPESHQLDDILIVVNERRVPMDHTKAAAGFGLLADPNRLRILGQLSQEGEQSATQLLAALPDRAWLE